VQLALIPPHSMRSQMAMGSLHLVLPWQATTDDQKSFVRSLPGYKILDNGAAENQLAKAEQLSDLLDTDMFDEVVIPDKLTDMQWTIDTARIFKSFKSDFPGINLLGVVQGETLAEVISCYSSFLHSMPWIDI
jgi:hypothetical protein